MRRTGWRTGRAPDPIPSHRSRRRGSSSTGGRNEAVIRGRSLSCCPTRWTSIRSKRLRALRGQVNVSIGWGTNLTNDFVGCAPAGVDGQLKAISFVCKVVEADGLPAVKLSDNPNKVMGPPEEVERYRRVFGLAGMRAAPVTV